MIKRSRAGALGILLLVTFFLSNCEFEEAEFIKPIPKLAQAKTVTQVSFVASWWSVLGADNYRVDVALDPDFKSIVSRYNNRQVSDTFLLIDALSVNTAYYYRVSYERKKQLSDPSVAEIATTKGFDIPVVYPAEAITELGFTAKWKEVQGAEAYLLEFSDNPAFDETGGHEPIRLAETSYTFQELEVFKTYYFKVKAVSGENNSAPSKVISAQTTNLQKPSLGQVTELLYTSGKISWNAVHGAKSYLIDVSTDPTFSTFAPRYENKEVNGLFETLTNLNANTSYYYRVRAKSSRSASEYSNVGNLHTRSIDKPTLLPPTAINHEGFTISWNTTNQAESYLLTIYENATHTIPVEA